MPDVAKTIGFPVVLTGDIDTRPEKFAKCSLNIFLLELSFLRQYEIIILKH
jgi:hypothetical protein